MRESAERGALPELTRIPAEPRLDTTQARRIDFARAASRAQLVVAALVLAIIVLAAIFAPFITPYDPTAISLGSTLKAPTLAHWFGTDSLGRDLFSRALVGARVSLTIAALAVAVAGIGGSLLGITAGYLGGAVDAIVMRLADIQLALPALILALVLVGAIGAGTGNLILVLSLANWARFARVVRSEALSLREREFVLLARLAGASRLRIIARHIAPNVVNTFIVLATLDIGSIIVLEATLSFVGLGVQPPTPSWGSMMSDGRGYLENAWWICVMPGILLMLTVLSANLLGDALRDRLNPSMSRRW